MPNRNPKNSDFIRMAIIMNLFYDANIGHANNMNGTKKCPLVVSEHMR